MPVAHQTSLGFHLPPQLSRESKKLLSSMSAHPNYRKAEIRRTEQSKQDKQKADFVPQKVTQVLARDFSRERELMGTSLKMLQVC